MGEKKFDPKKRWSTKFEGLKKWGPKNFVKIVTDTAEMLLIWSNVARIYVA